MLNLTQSQCIEIKRRLKPIKGFDKDKVFDEYLDTSIAPPTKILGREYLSSQILRHLDIKVYYEELDHYFEQSDEYTRLGKCNCRNWRCLCPFYKTPQIRRLLEIKKSAEQCYQNSVKEREQVYKRLADS